MEETAHGELIKKYQWAGRIRCISAVLFFAFLWLMKTSGAYGYINIAVAGLVFVEAFLNQPYQFLLKRVDAYHFQYYQMATDIITISWLVYYLGGIEAPVVSIGYYVVILWAGVVSGQGAVFFSVFTSALFFSFAVILAHYGILPAMNYSGYRMQTEQVFSLLLGNIAFMFAFGYFSARSAGVIRLLQKKRTEESLKNSHRLLATGYLLSGIAHDVLNHLAGIKNYARLLLEAPRDDTSAAESLNPRQVLENIARIESENIELLSMLTRFSQRHRENLAPLDLNTVIDKSLKLIVPMAHGRGCVIEFGPEKSLPQALADEEQIQEAIITLFLGWLDTGIRNAKASIKTYYQKDKNCAKITVHLLMPEEMPPEVSASHSAGETLDIGPAIVQEIISRHKGTLVSNTGPHGERIIIIELPCI